MTAPEHRGIIVLSPRMTVSDGDLAQLREAGYIPLIGRPGDVRMMLAVSELDGNSLNIAALQVCNGNDTRRQEFGKLILDTMILQLGDTK